MLDKEVVVIGIVALEKDLPCKLATLGITGGDIVVAEEGILCMGPCPTEFAPDSEVFAVFLLGVLCDMLAGKRFVLSGNVPVGVKLGVLEMEAVVAAGLTEFGREFCPKPELTALAASCW